ncbi:MAG: acyl-CoA dehydrogenase [Rhodospirillaceae bacterium]|jgi:alkylation response protein AidB-like acyl-CoA dehydrogenase|nr:acyl-CoA dehydrogenase [Rhodospirillaceae bacterium]MBT3932317.1 acyl-CoA dehydrogenase [Rhodospirillaceae bacterium]MBT4773962.1 acyl-CoA dehydrogenase [Rhodospirillaceae bacterium]MBT5357529.1 acyl-CoA dehydrogenase [Rhodospirillaceae bacterium]MBT5770518.1 acyl-CoA dehydrogenase [Rhodospirillaceae bacterium]
MSDYNAPVQDMQFILENLCDMDGLRDLPVFAETTSDLVEQILNESARFTGEVVAPLNQTGDQQTSTLSGSDVTTPDGFKEAYQAFVDGGWNGTPFEAEHGGMGLPWTLTTALQEMWQSSNLAWSLCPLLTIGAIESVIAHGAPELKEKFLEKLVSGEWTGTMNLTEPQAGTDLSLLKSRADREGDHYRIKGTKIFITYGDQDFTDNIIHLVLARLPDAPPGVKGISLFLVPKFLVNDDGSLGERNDAHVIGLEHKLGIHASPTCVIAYGENGDGAVGYLIGEEHDGLRCMFTMMNNARLNVGLQGVSIAERAYQHAVAYARERVQSAPVEGGKESVTIIQHPDVRRMLMSMRAQTEAMRALAYYTNSALDRSRHHDDPQARGYNQRRTDLLTPVVKAWCTDLGVDIASIGVQVHGGMGFIEETGAAQYFRDSRIAPIYEGTNGIQAIDLLGRKLMRDGGAAMEELLEELDDLPDSEDPEIATIIDEQKNANRVLRHATEWMLDPANNDVNRKFAGAHAFLHLAGTVVGGWLMTRSALAAASGSKSGASPEFLDSKRITARFYADHILPRANMHLETITRGGDSVMALAEDRF